MWLSERQSELEVEEINEESFAKMKEKLYFMALDTYLYSKQLQKYKNSCNLIDKNLATMLNKAVDNISDFLDDAQYEDDINPNLDVNDMIPSIDSNMLQAHRYYFCNCCTLSVKASSKSFNDHFFSNKHLVKLREASTKMDMLANGNEGDTPNAAKREREPKRPRAPKPPTSLTRKMKDFLTTSDIKSFTMKLVENAQQLFSSNRHARVSLLVAKTLSQRYPNVKVYPFGSSVTGLGQWGGDLDIFVDVNNSYHKKPSKRLMKNSIHKVQDILRSQGGMWNNFEPVLRARTPILRVYCRGENIDCDMSFSNGLSACNTQLIAFLVGEQPVSRMIIMFMKTWVQELKLDINSYLVSLLVIFYFQQLRLLPTVRELQDAIEPTEIDEWQCNFAPTPISQLRIPKTNDFYGHLVGFFNFYSEMFDFENHIVCVLTGKPEMKKMFDHGEEELLPPAFERYKNYMSKIDIEQADEVEDLFSNFKPLVVQDPFELCHNVAKGIQSSKLVKIVEYLKLTHEILRSRFPSDADSRIQNVDK